MTLIDITVMLAVSLGSVLSALYLIFMLRRKAPKGISATTAPITFLFEDRLLVHATQQGYALFTFKDRDIGWGDLSKVFQTRFPSFPADIPPIGSDPIEVPSTDPEDPGTLCIKTIGNCRRVELVENDSDLRSASWHSLRSAEIMERHLEDICQSAPFPMWRTDQEGKILWANQRYEDIRGAAGDSEATPVLCFKLTDQRRRARVSVTFKDTGHTSWFDVSATPREKDILFHGINIDAVIEAEIAQRNFVQTLAKTFAQLATGLAIFDRNRQLVLFNPALVNLTGLPAEFLSARPELLTFFDNLRDRRIMPEPKNYAEWRQEIADVIDRASDGYYEETWSLLNGKTYRIVGRPHPDGAIAFLLEDISAEVSQTRNYRSELEISRAALDTVDEAVLVVTEGGQVTYSNKACRTLWSIDPSITFANMRIADCLKIWRGVCPNEGVWERVEEFVQQSGDRQDWQSQVRDAEGRTIYVTLSRLPGRATAIRFRLVKQVEAHQT